MGPHFDHSAKWLFCKAVAHDSFDRCPPLRPATMSGRMPDLRLREAVRAPSSPAARCPGLSRASCARRTGRAVRPDLPAAAASEELGERRFVVSEAVSASEGLPTARTCIMQVFDYHSASTIVALFDIPERRGIVPTLLRSIPVRRVGVPISPNVIPFRRVDVPIF